MVISPIPIDPYPHLKDQIKKLGSVEYVIAPNKYHWLYLKDFMKHYPNAKSYSSLSLQEKLIKVQGNENFFKFDYILSKNKTHENWKDEIVQI